MAIFIAKEGLAVEQLEDTNVVIGMLEKLVV